MTVPVQPEVRAGQVWTDSERGQVRVLAVTGGYAMLKRRRRNPFLASTDQMLAGDYGWQLVDDTPPADAEGRAPDVGMALHWIDRYAAGIDNEFQIALVAKALGVTLPDGYVAALAQQPDPKPKARGVVDDDDGLPAGFAGWYNRKFRGRGADTRHLSDCEESWRAALTEARNVR